ncbi:MAG: single-stranded DNA-binding protein [Chloroflexi bacterium]|nr:single-stranded DNA-binding protein [Chloroflexota bacterium]MCI0784533.1 single-stranded DNA-binding protein [Chloroflexota bacterium]MCI0814230.1 single-stranded DNA-binding protein [Chloroflexota bacterium]MCI0818560.1 single-stranded DNA-binding protein [Chloroflexota bacterium]MCI0819604.1 single-stranded DNA-binding protein [Chloroflexota bacterium]
MAGLNKVMVIGNLGADPEMRYTADGAAVTNFRIAASRNYTASDGERKEETEWFRIVAFGKLAELCNQYLQKGRRVYVEGRLQTRSWEGQDGQKRYTTEVIAQDVQFLDSKPGGAPQGDNQDAAMDLEPEDVPFE